MGTNVFFGCSNLTIYCEALSQPTTWNTSWNPDNIPVVWGGAPRNLNYTVIGQDVTLNWITPLVASPYFLGYRVYHNTQLLTPSHISELTYTVLNVPFATHTFGVSAVYTEFESAITEITVNVLVPVPGAVVLTLPTNNATNLPINQTLTWQAPTGIITGYRVYIGTPNLPTEPTTTVTTTSFTSTLIHGSTYQWRVVAFNDSGDGESSSTWSFTTQIAPPGQVTLLTPTNNATNIPLNHILTWQAASGTVSGYKVFIGTTSLPTEPTATVSTTSFTPTLVHGTNYQWRVVAFNDTGDGDSSATWSFTTITAPQFSINPTTHDFGNVINGLTSEIQSFTVTNTGGADLTVSSIPLTGTDMNQFSVTATGLPWTITAGGNQTFNIVFSPTSTGVKTANVSINHNATGSPTNVTLSGTSIVPPLPQNLTHNVNGNYITLNWQPPSQQPVASLSSATQSSQQPVASLSSATQSEYNEICENLRNPSNLRANPTGYRVYRNGTLLTSNPITALTFTDPNVQAGQHIYSVVAVYSTVSSAPTNTPQITLVNPAISVSPSPYDFGNMIVGQSSAPQTFTINNISGHSMIVSEVSLTGVDMNQFSATITGLPWTIPAGEYQTFNVVFNPTSVGSKSAGVSIVHNANGSPTSISLTGTGIVDVPGQITLLTPTDNATNISLNHMLSWQPASGTVSGYKVFIGTPNLPTEPTATVTTTSFTPTLAHGTTYQWRVVAFNTTGDGDSSATWSFTTQIAPPGQVTLLTPTDNATNISLDHMLTWQPASGTVSGYKVFIGTPNLPTEPTATVSSTSFSPTLSHGTTYQWRVVAFNDTGDGESSATWNFTTQLAPPIFEINPTSHDFGAVTIGETSTTQIFTITNTGGSDLVVSSIILTGANQNEFDTTVSGLPWSIEAGKDREFNVSYSPVSAGTKVANVNIIHNANGSPAVIAVSGEGSVSENDTADMVLATGLMGNFPNPFNPETTISFVVARHALPVQIEVYNIRGQLIRTLLDGSRALESGRHSVIWDGRDDNGNQVSSGIYLYRMRAGEYQSTRRMILMK
jgi:predicted RNA-binding protein with TRAM domain